MSKPPPITEHAILRYRQRVRPNASPQQARHEIAELLAAGRRQPRPRHWTSRLGWLPGSLYVYSASRPDVCVVIREGLVRTVYSRRTCRNWARLEPLV